jgi:hypothetical protein
VFKKRAILVAGLLAVGVGVAAGILVWRGGSPDVAARKLVGDWGVVESGPTLGEKVIGAVEKKDPELAVVVGDKFRSTERISFDGSGALRYTQDFAGMIITEEGTWQATEREDGKLLVKIHKTKLSLHNPQKRETKVDAQDAIVEWAVSVVDPDRLSVTMTDSDGKRQCFGLSRARD